MGTCLSTRGARNKDYYVLRVTGHKTHLLTISISISDASVCWRYYHFVSSAQLIFSTNQHRWLPYSRYLLFLRFWSISLTAGRLSATRIKAAYPYISYHQCRVMTGWVIIEITFLSITLWSHTLWSFAHCTCCTFYCPTSSWTRPFFHTESIFWPHFMTLQHYSQHQLFVSNNFSAVSY